MTTLTKQVLTYQETGRGLSRLIDEIAKQVYSFPSGRQAGSSEDSAEFLIRFMPRITRLIRRYQDTGQSFESYLATTLRWQIKSLAAQKARDRVRESALCATGGELWRAESDRAVRSGHEVHESALSLLSSGVSDGEPSSSDDGVVDRPLPAGRAKRLIHLSLKLAEQLGEEEYRRIARTTGCEEQWLVDCWQRLRDRCDAQRLRRHEAIERRDRTWFKLRCVEHRLNLVLEPEERKTLEHRLEIWKHRHSNAVRIVRRMQCGPSHTDIAAVLGIPKGTVDSSVFYAKKELLDPEYRSRVATAISNA